MGGAYRIIGQGTKSNFCQSITGVVAPITPIVPGSTFSLFYLDHIRNQSFILSAYRKYDYPWFDLYDEHLPELGATDRFRNLRSVRQLDTSTMPTPSSQSSDLPDPADPPYCSSHSVNKAGCVLRPCGHYGCETCVGRVIMGGNKCPVCGQPVSRLVGFQKPIPQVNVNVGAGSEGDWWSVEEMIDGIRVGDDSEKASVITLVLNEDNVSRLGGATV